MTLATRCPRCGTTFRVVSDQLKLRKGLVKCGHCQHVFNGIEFLHYFAEPTVPNAAQLARTYSAPPVAESAASVESAAAVESVAPPESASPVESPSPNVRTSPSLPAAEATAEAAEPAFAATPPETDDQPFMDEARREPIFAAPREMEEAPTAHPIHHEAMAATSGNLSRMAAESEAPSELAPLTLIDVARQGGPVRDDFEELPAFLRDKRRAPAWVRALVALLAITAALGLAAQIVHAYRAEIAARYPALHAPLAALCAALPDPVRCEVGLPRHITQLRVSGAELQTVASGSFNLVVTLRNDADTAQAYPTLDVILSNVRNQPVIRRAVGPDEYLRGLRDAAERLRIGLAPKAETTLALPLRIDDESVVGYTVGIFYP